MDINRIKPAVTEKILNNLDNGSSASALIKNIDDSNDIINKLSNIIAESINWNWSIEFITGYLLELNVKSDLGLSFDDDILDVTILANDLMTITIFDDDLFLEISKLFESEKYKKLLQDFTIQIND